jgi:hypothetical protein
VKMVRERTQNRDAPQALELQLILHPHPPNPQAAYPQ